MESTWRPPDLCSMGNFLLHPADTRGNADHGWLKSRHTFSFGNYFDPLRIRFGALRVLNDDQVAAGMGFGEHPHENMEIVSIPLEGALDHRDSLGNRAVIRRGDIQTMSAGTGVRHSEYNHSRTEPVAFLQIWVLPDRKDVQPRYGQVTLRDTDLHNRLQQVVSPDPDDEGVWIHQSAWFHMGRFDENIETRYDIRRRGNGLYAFVIKGRFDIDGVRLQTRDGAGFTESDSVAIRALSPEAEILLIDVQFA